MKSRSGKFYGIGVGPGDPELIPVKAIKILKAVDVVFTASSTKNDFSIAVDIARQYIPETTEIRKMPFPMCKDRAPKENAWRMNAGEIAAVLESGRDAAFLTLGDPLTYSTYGYTVKHLATHWPQLEIVTIPGITSYQAAAALNNTPLVEGEESLMILSGVTSGERLRRMLRGAENMVFLKAYRNLQTIYDTLDEADLVRSSIGIVNCGRPNEVVYEDIGQMLEQPPNYWSLIITKRGQKNGEA